MGKCKTKAIQTDLGLFRHNQAYPGIIQAYSGIFSTLCKPGNLGLWYIQNPDIFRTRSIFRTPVYSERWHIQNSGHQTSTIKRFAKIVDGYNYFHKL